MKKFMTSGLARYVTIVALVLAASVAVFGLAPDSPSAFPVRSVKTYIARSLT